MEKYILENLNDDILLLIPIDAEIPFSEIVEDFNNCKGTFNTEKVIIDMLVYLGNHQKRFKEVILEEGKMKLSNMITYEPNRELLDKSYEMFSQLPMGFIQAIISPSIRKTILKKNNKREILPNYLV